MYIYIYTHTYTLYIYNHMHTWLILAVEGDSIASEVSECLSNNNVA